MKFQEMVALAGAEVCLPYLEKSLVLSGEQVAALINGVSPVFIGALHRIMLSPNERVALRRLIRSGGPQQYIDKPRLLVANVAEIEGRSLLRFLLVTDSVFKSTVVLLADSTRLKVSKVDQALPLLACLFFGVVCKKVLLDHDESTA